MMIMNNDDDSKRNQEHIIWGLPRLRLVPFSADHNILMMVFLPFYYFFRPEHQNLGIH